MKQFWIILVLCSLQCKDDATEQAEQSVKEIPNSLLLFQAEQEAEFWIEGQVNKLTINKTSSLPIGQYSWRESLLMNAEDTIDLVIVLEDHEWLNQSGDAFIFPNDARQTGQFHPCFRCPYSTTAIYSGLWLHLQDYQLGDQ